ncbi:MAG: hypothetical protein ABI785_08480 [Gemmatimonadales bacterium]
MDQNLACVYCGSTKQLTDDHVPPKQLFQKPRPSDLVTVPSCWPCNSGFQSDDDYFRTVLALRIDDRTRPAARPFREATLRGLRRPEAQGFASEVRKSLVLADLPPLPDGSIQLAGQWVDGARINRSTQRLIRAFFWRERGHRLPRGYRTTGGLFETASAFLPILLPLLASGGGERILAGGQFDYVWGEAPDDPDTTAWWFTFFGRYSFIGVTAIPPTAAPSLRSNKGMKSDGAADVP